MSLSHVDTVKVTETAFKPIQTVSGLLMRKRLSHQLEQHVDKVLVQSAAEAAIVQHHDLSFATLHRFFISYQLAVYVYLAKLHTMCIH